jgi:hypothetical protein
VACELNLPAFSEEITQPLILLDFALMKNEGETKDHIMDMVAHEIGHCIPGHMGVNDDYDCEKKADDLAEKWGFKRVYDNYDKFEKLKSKQNHLKSAIPIGSELRGITQIFETAILTFDDPKVIFGNKPEQSSGVLNPYRNKKITFFLGGNKER